MWAKGKLYGRQWFQTYVWSHAEEEENNGCNSVMKNKNQRLRNQENKIIEKFNVVKMKALKASKNIPHPKHTLYTCTMSDPVSNLLLFKSKVCAQVNFKVVLSTFNKYGIFLHVKLHKNLTIAHGNKSTSLSVNKARLADGLFF